MTDQSRRKILQTAGLLSAAGLTGCTNILNRSDTKDKNTVTQRQQKTTTETTTKTPQTAVSTVVRDFETVLDLEMPRVDFVHRVSGDGSPQVTGTIDIEDENGVGEVEVLLDGKKVEPTNKLLESQLSNGDENKNVSLDLVLDSNLVGPDSEVEIKARDSMGGGEWDKIIEREVRLRTEENVQSRKPAYVLDFKDKNSTAPESGYTTERRWDDITVERTEEDWWNLYYTDIKQLKDQFGASVRIGSVQDVKQYLIDRIREDRGVSSPQELGMLERADSLRQYLGEYFHDHQKQGGSGGASNFYVRFQRMLAEDIWGMGMGPRFEEDSFMHVQLGGNDGSHEVQASFYRDETGWNVRYHNPLLFDQEFEGKAFWKPEESPYRAGVIEKGRSVGPFVYDKLHRTASKTDDDHYETRDIHSIPAYSLMSIVNDHEYPRDRSFSRSHRALSNLSSRA